MAVRALIVAVQSYPHASGLAQELPGTNDAATTFCRWLADRKGVFPKGDPRHNPRMFFCCADDEVPFRTHGTSRPEIIQAIVDLQRAGKDDTEELYCYFGGHGFCYPRDEIVQDDIFVASDFRSLDVSGGACLKLKELMDLLTPAMGPGDHYYFLDACRTEIPFGRVRPTDMGVTFERSQLGFAGKAVLFSIEQGLAARTDSRFSQHLVEGLGGAGRAKGWYNDVLYVKFDYLWNYVEKKIGKKVSHQIGESEGLILKIDPILPEKCRIRVEEASPVDRFAYSVKRRSTTVLEGEFRGAEHELSVPEPGDYQIEVRHHSATLVRIEPPPPAPVDLYQPAQVLYRKLPPGLENMLSAGPDAERGRLSIAGAPNAVIRVESVFGDHKLSQRTESVTAELDPGDYTIILEEAGQVVARRALTVKAGESIDVDLLAEPPSPLHAAILAHVAPPGARAVDFSETLDGPTADRDLGLWLAFLGASRIVGDPGEFSKLSRVPLTARFDNVPPGGSAIYVLAGIERQAGPCAVALGRNPRWAEMSPVSGVAELFEFSTPIEPGPELLTFQAKGRAPVTVSTHALPNRATLLALSSSDGPAPIRLYQFLLPTKRLIRRLPFQVRSRINATPLKITRFLAQVQRLFAQDHSLSKAFAPDSATADVESQNRYEMLISSKWLDPVASIIAANDLLRRGVLNPKSPLAQFRGVLPVMVRNLRRWFGSIPDIEAFAKSIGKPWNLPSAPPLLADSLAGFSLEEQKKFLPFENDRRLFGTPWVAWVSAVEPFPPFNP